MKNSLYLALLITACIAAPAWAQTPPATTAVPTAATAEQPLEISADTSLEWESQKKQYLAKGRATAKQGDFSVTGDTLTADYRDGAGGKTEIWQLTATGNVEIISGTSKAYGENAVYRVDEGKAVMTGKNLRLEGEQMKLTASERFEYYKDDGRMVAVGTPVVTHGTDTLKANTITAWVYSSAEKKATPNASGLKRAEATGNVVITTPTEVATGNKAIYLGDRNTAELLENVKITRGPNTLEGARAEIDLTTKISKIFGTQTENAGNGRVKGVFFPSSDKKQGNLVTKTPVEPEKRPETASEPVPVFEKTPQTPVNKPVVPPATP